MQDILEFVNNNFTPTEDQNNALIEFSKFFKSDKSCFILKGYAGTGKTFLLKCIADYLSNEKINIVLMAPTGRASRILSEKTKQNSTTIHRGIYNLDEVDEISTSNNGKEKFKFRYNLNHIESNTRNFYLIDESSMISDKYSENDFFIFGSGRLLKDLISYIAPSNIGRKDKIIFVGDPAQLPPITDNISGALSSNYLKETFDLETYEYELTEVVRQQQESGILANATYIRNLLEVPKSKRNSFELKTTYSDITKIDSDDTVKTFLNENSELSIAKTIFINHSNKSAFDYNFMIREKLFKDKVQITNGDILIINQNNYNYETELLNGMLVKVLEVSPVPEIKSGLKSYDEKGKDCKVTHKFRRIRIAVPTEKGETQISCLILENFLNSPNPSLDYSENIALYLDFKIRNSHLKPKTKEFADTLRKDPYFNSLRVKYGYAITCHKAQGGEWESVIVNLDVSQGKLSDNFLRWTYTAITRASRKLYLFNIPKENQFSRLIYSNILLEDKNVNETLIDEIEFFLPDNFKNIISSFGLENADNFKKDKLIEILAIANSINIEVIERHHHKYQEIYVFEFEGKNAGINFWYNGRNKFTRTQIARNYTNDIDFSNKLLSNFVEQVNIILTEKKETLGVSAMENQILQIEKYFGTKHEPYKILYKELVDLFTDKKIVIENIVHKNFQEIYYLKRENEKAVIQFYYDGLNRFTRVQPILTQCNSNELLNSVNKVIMELIKR